MTFSILDIIVFSAGGIIIGIYAFFSIRRLVRFKKAYNKYIKDGFTPLQAKQQAMKDCYPKKYAKDEKKNNKSNMNDEIFED